MEYTNNAPMSKNHRLYWIFLTLISLAGMGMAVYATVPFGAGIAGDAASYMSTAENLLRGKGFFDHFGNPLVFWPPLYPVVLAGLGALTHGDVFLGGWYLNILLLGVNIFLSGALLYSIFPDKTLFRYIGCVFVLISISALRIHTNVASDPLFIAFSLIFLIASNRYLDGNSKSAFGAMILLSALASLNRFLGLSLVATGAVLILYKNWNNWRKMILDNLIFGSLSILPLAAWIIFHNIIGYGTFWGNLASIVLPWENLRLSLVKMLSWFIPLRFIPELVIKNPLLPLAIVFLLFMVFNRRKEWQAWGQAALSPRLFPTLLFLPVSILGLMVSIATADHVDLRSDRYYVGLLVPVLAWLYVTAEHLVHPHIKLRPATINVLSAMIFIIWSIYPVHEIWEFVIASRQNNGIAAYNIYNTKEVRNSETIAFVNELLAKNDEINLYSNNPNSVWFITRHTVKLLPWLNKGIPFDATVANNLSGWPGEQAGYIVWLKPDHFEVTVTPDELTQVARLELVFSSFDGDVYYVQKK